ncbi:MAG: GNAT family N-acetyltransferase [Chlorobium phaeobacteroides]|uniref:GCN5-related N-acetyltransferase n=1 Tax=Chlorobium phaeobacteroides (strain BS1) TaxID=331678 RepID=B3EJ73_CHLPB|nr:GNAT family N-acetyltransferase [Chlorobium phaeobacteroides]
MLVRYGNADDSDRCCELLGYLFDQEAEFFPDPETQQKGLEMIFNNPDSGTVFVCEERQSRVITGMVILLYTVSTALGKKVALLEDMIVDPAFRLQGIGNMLIEHALSHAASKGIERVTLLTDLDNTDAHRFYETNGFVRSGMIVFRKKISTNE